jgi:nitroreductase
MAQDHVAEILGLPAGLVVEAIIAIGYPAEQLPGHPRLSLPDEKVSFEQYGQKG